LAQVSDLGTLAQRIVDMTEEETLAKNSTPGLRRNVLSREAKKLNMEFDALYNKMTKVERDEFLDALYPMKSNPRRKWKMDNLPDFEQPAPTEAPSPKKPRRKPTRLRQEASSRQARKSAKIKAAPKRRPKKVRAPRKVAPSASNSLFTGEMYRLIGQLMNLDIPARNMIMEVVKGLTR